MSITAGDILDERYRVLAVHPGGMGVVYILKDQTTGEVHAAKTVKEELRDDVRVRRRFEREVRTWVRLGRHEHLVQAHFVRDIGGLPFLFLEYIDGPTLAQVLRADSPFFPAQAVDFAIQAARGLIHAQETPLGSDGRGLVHRDVKPENLFVARDRTVKVSDFGIAKVLSADLESTAEGIGMGTPFYVSPEQLKGSRGIDGRADVYSFGAVLYQMLTGEIPLQSESIETQIYRILRKMPDPPSHLNPSVPPELDRIVMQCLQKDPAARYESFRALTVDLLAVLADGARKGADSPASACRDCGYASARVPETCPVCAAAMVPGGAFIPRAEADSQDRAPAPATLEIAAVEASPRTVRVGEELSVTIRIVNQSRHVIRPCEMVLPIPDLDLFRTKDAEEVWRGEVPPTLPGHPFRVTYSLIPLREGTFDLPPPLLSFGKSLGQSAVAPGVGFTVTFNYRLPLVGREEDRRALLDFARRGRAGFALVSGESGSGRSRILREVGEELSATGVTVLNGKALERAREPLKVFHDIARKIFGIREGPLGSSSSMARVIDRLDPLVGHDPAMAGFFAAFLRGAELPASQLRMRGYLWFRLLSALAREGPVVLVLGDLHWGDEDSVDLAETLVRRAAEEEVPLTIIAGSLRTDSDEGTKRRIARLAERFAAMSATPGLTLRVLLARLNEAEVGQLLECVFPGNTLAEDHPWLLPALTTQSGGNPFHVVQMLKKLRESRDEQGEPLVSAEGGDWTLRSEITEEKIGEWIPEAVEDMVRAMVTPFPAAVRDVLERAAVIGEEVEVSLLEEIFDDPKVLDESLEVLEQADLIRMRGVSGERFRFTSSQLPRIVEGLLRERSRRTHARLHLQVAGALKRLLSRRDLRNSARRYARHLRLGGERVRALRWLVISAETAVRQQLYRRADSVLSRAGELLGEGVAAGRRVLGTYFFLRGEVSRVTGQLDEALEAFEQATTHLSGPRAREIMARTMSRTGRIHEVRGENDRALICFALSARIQEEIGDIAGLSLSLGDLGSVQLQQGDEDAAQISFVRAEQLAKESGEPRALANTLDRLADLQVRRGEWGKAESIYRETLGIWERIADRLGTAQALNGLGNMALRRGRLQEARDHYQRAIELRREVGDREGTANLLSNLGVIHDRLGEFEKALRFYRRSAEAHRAIGSRRGLALVLNNIGVVNLARGDVGLAIGRFEEALSIRRRIGDPDRIGHVLVNLGEAYLAAGRFEDSEQALDEALEVLLGAEDAVELAGVFVARAELMLRRGDLAQSQRELERGSREDNPDPLIRCGLHLGMAELLTAHGEIPGALACADRALAQAKESGDRLALARVQRVRGGALKEAGRMEEALLALGEAERLLKDGSGPELARVYLCRAAALKENDPARSREVMMRARGLLDALAARGAVLTELGAQDEP